MLLLLLLVTAFAKNLSIYCNFNINATIFLYDYVAANIFLQDAYLMLQRRKKKIHFFIYYLQLFFTEYFPFAGVEISFIIRKSKEEEKIV